MGATLKGKNLLPSSFKILSFKSSPQIRSDTVCTIKVKDKNEIFFYLSEGMENCKLSGKNQGKVREF